jgi:predicted HTH transcriptional regulator
MDEQELARLLKELESDRAERKASPSDGKKIRQAICAFANDLPNHKKPGVLFIGVKDNGTCANLPITDQLLIDLASIRSEGKILPLPVLQVNKYKEIDGSLIELLRYLDEILQANISTASDITTNPLEIKKPDYPIVALQQLIRNAIMHRSYEQTNAPVKVYWFNDRIEIHSPGGLFGQVNRQNFGKGVTDYRNPHLAEAMKNLGYVQRFGIGIATAQKQLEKNGNPAAEFQIEEANFLAIVRRTK